MNDPDQFERLVRKKLAAADEQRRRRQATFHAEMLAREQRIEQFDALAGRLMGSIVSPRMKRLCACFDNARLDPSNPARPRRCACVFDHTAMFPASATLEINLSADEAVTTGTLNQSLEILPILFEYEKGDAISFPIEHPDDERLATWIDGRLLGFVDTYLRLAESDAYQHDNLVIDPVCGARINKLLAGAQTELNGQTYYFCMDECRRKFLESPSHYLASRTP